MVAPTFFVVVLVFIIVNLICSIFWPRMMWYLSEGWKFKNAEPSGCVLAVYRIGGVIGLVVLLGIAWSLGFKLK
jgi:hypothetical protein